MKYRMIVSVPLLGMLTAALACPQSSATSQTYTVYDLGPGGNPGSSGSAMNSRGVVVGSDSTVFVGGVLIFHAAIWYGESFLDLESIVPGPNSAAGAVNDFGLVLLRGDTLVQDPNNENFCGYDTGLQCIVMTFSNGLLSQLPSPLGGLNSGLGGINNRGEVAGFAENTVRDPDCLVSAPNGTGPQLFDYEAVIWGPAAGQFRQLPPLPGDSVAMALGINAAGEAVGISGSCGNTVIPPSSAGPHAVLWDANGTVYDLGNFGGTSNPAILGVGNGAFAINDQGVVVGTSALPINRANQPFLWTSKQGIQHLPLLTGDEVGSALAINNLGEVVGASMSARGRASGTSSAVVWQKGTQGGVTDLNLSLSSSSSFVALLTALGINDKGQIVGMGITKGGGEVHAFLAVPSEAAEGDESAASAVRAAPAQIELAPRVRKMISGRHDVAK